jgi:hypothetical protein
MKNGTRLLLAAAIMAVLGIASVRSHAADPVCPVAVDADDHGTCSVRPPPGTGLDKDGRGWVHCMVPGLYVFHGGYVGGKTEPIAVMCGRDPNAGRGAFASIQQTSSLLEWTRPDGVREVIPRERLYPPF